MNTYRKSNTNNSPVTSTKNTVRTSLSNGFSLIRGAIGATFLLLKSI